jgi:hypothetical protein
MGPKRTLGKTLQKIRCYSKIGDGNKGFQAKLTTIRMYKGL